MLYLYPATLEKNEHDIIDRFVAEKYTFVTLEHLFPALKLFLFGLALATGVFFMELAIHSLLSNFNIKWMTSLVTEKINIQIK